MTVNASGIIEAYNTGIPKMMRSYAGYPAQPVIETSDNAFKITLPNQNRDAVPPTVKESALSEREETVIALLKTKESIVRKNEENALSVSQGTATRIIREMLHFIIGADTREWIYDRKNPVLTTSGFPFPVLTYCVITLFC